MQKSDNSYPFGNVAKGRSFSSTAYRYGFNGKEKDNEVSGDGNEYDFGARMLDSRLGRFLSIDAEFREDPDITPYRFGLNSPISYFDPDGNYEADGKLSKKQDKDVKTTARAEAIKTKGKYKDIYQKMKTEKETENVNKIAEIVKNAKSELDGNPKAKEAFEQLTGSKEGSDRYDNFFMNNGKGPKISLTDVGFSANTSEFGIDYYAIA